MNPGLRGTGYSLAHYSWVRLQCYGQRQWWWWWSIVCIDCFCLGIVVVCDVCNQTITGVRYKCGQVQNFLIRFQIFFWASNTSCLHLFRNIYLFLIALIVLFQLLSGLWFMCVMWVKGRGSRPNPSSVEDASPTGSDSAEAICPGTSLDEECKWTSSGCSRTTNYWAKVGFLHCMHLYALISIFFWK